MGFILLYKVSGGQVNSDKSSEKAAGTTNGRPMIHSFNGGKCPGGGGRGVRSIHSCSRIAAGPREGGMWGWSDLHFPKVNSVVTVIFNFDIHRSTMSPILIFPLSLCVLTTTLGIRVDPVLTHTSFSFLIHGISFSIETLVQSFCLARRKSGTSQHAHVQHWSWRLVHPD